jgi:hypothetical protein
VNVGQYQRKPRKEGKQNGGHYESSKAAEWHTHTPLGQLWVAYPLRFFQRVYPPWRVKALFDPRYLASISNIPSSNP